MSFTGKEDHSFPLAQAAEWTANYRKQHPGETQGHYFGEHALKQIMNQHHCVGIRIYYALNEQGEKQLIIVGVDKHENDLFQGLLAERSVACPPFCGIKNPLNSSL
jgi:hypothetical protein